MPIKCIETISKTFYYDVDVDVVDQDKNLTGDGNFIAFRIYAPREFTDRWNAEEFSTNVGKFLYKEDIKNNGVTGLLTCKAVT